MLTPNQQSRLDRKCAQAAAEAVDAFPDLLAACEAEAAATIVADLIKTNLARPIAQPDPTQALAAIVNRCMSDD